MNDLLNTIIILLCYCSFSPEFNFRLQTDFKKEKKKTYTFLNKVPVFLAVMD